VQRCALFLAAFGRARNLTDAPTTRKMELSQTTAIYYKSDYFKNTVRSGQEQSCFLAHLAAVLTRNGQEMFLGNVLIFILNRQLVAFFRAQLGQRSAISARK